MSATDEQPTRDQLDGILPRLQESAVSYPLHGQLANIKSFEVSDKCSPDGASYKVLHPNLPLFTLREQINDLGKRLNGIVRGIQPKPEANHKLRKYSFKTKPVCYRCRRRGHIKYYCF